MVSRSASPFSTLKQNIDHVTYFSLYQTHGLLELSATAISLQRLQEVGGFKPEFRGAEDFELIMRALHNHTLAYDPIPSSYYRCNNPNSHSRKFALNVGCLTAYFRALQSLEGSYCIPAELLAGNAKTLASKSMLLQDSSDRQTVLELVLPYLSRSHQILFTIASYFPAPYLWLNDLRNKMRGPQYGPRQAI